MSSGENSGTWVWLAAFWCLLGAACDREPVAAAGAKGLTSPSSAPLASGAPLPEPEPPCPKYVDGPKWGHGGERVTIALSAPVESRTVELRGTGVQMTFGFYEFLRAAECLNQRLVVDYLRSRPRGEQVVNITDQEDRQFAVPVAALLDAGHAKVTALGSGKRAETVVKTFWIWMGCGGGCRHMGRSYLLSIPGDEFFQITDGIAHGLPSPKGTQ